MKNLRCWLIGFIAVWAPHPPLDAADKVRITVTNPNMSFLPLDEVASRMMLKSFGLGTEKDLKFIALGCQDRSSVSHNSALQKFFADTCGE